MKTCNKCGESYRTVDNFCRRCGMPLVKRKDFCQAVLAGVPDDALRPGGLGYGILMDAIANIRAAHGEVQS